GAFQGADDVVTALHDHPGDLAYACSVAQQLVVGFEKPVVDEVMGLYTRKGERKLILFVVAGEGRVGQQLGGGAFPSAPDLRSGESHSRIITREAAVVCGEQIAL